MDTQAWIDKDCRYRAIQSAAQHNPILHNALNTARVNGLDRSVGLECALLMLCEENKRLFDYAVEAESRAVPRHRIVPE